jgi:hypothetical protein
MRKLLLLAFVLAAVALPGVPRSGAAPAPLPTPKRTTVVQEPCGACSGRGTLYVWQAKVVVDFVVCPYCAGSGKTTVEILPMPAVMPDDKPPRSR